MLAPDDHTDVATASLPATQRSRTGNNPAYLVGADNRGAWARRRRDLIERLAMDLGGPDVLSEQQRILLNRACTLTTECERLETRFSVTEPSLEQLAAYSTATNSLKRLIETLGLKRVPREIDSLDQYLQSRKDSANG